MYRTELDEVMSKNKKKTSLKNNTSYFPWLALLLVCVRVSGALLCPPLDCDETFNYWEPLHYLVYGWGLQTWEYSPEFALRSYVPLWALAAPMSALAAPMSALSLSPRHLYYLTRALLACLHAAAEITLAAALKHAFHPEVGSVFLWLSGCGAGSWAMAGALLPAAWCAALGGAALASWLRARSRLASALHAASALLAWPFAAAMGLPLAHDILKGWRSAWRVAATGAAAGAALCLALAAVDSWAYGRPVLAPLNILLYNVGGGGGGGGGERGPHLYGTEPPHFYFLNLLLNLNVAWLLALVSPVALVRRWRWGWGARGAWLWAVAALWLAIFTLQPHKEERFMYPAYPALLALAALSAYALLPGRRARALALGAALVLGGARAAALHFYYSAPMQLFNPLETEGVGGAGAGVRWVCLGAHWHRVGGSFLLPARGYRLRFLPSAHAGQLPAPYAEHANGTRVVHEHFNDANVGDARTYLPLHACHYALLADEERPPHPAAGSSSSSWVAVASAPLLVAERSPRATRALYLPLLSPALNSYTRLHLLRNTDLVEPSPA